MTTDTSSRDLGKSRWMIAVVAVFTLVIALLYAWFTIFSRDLSVDEGYLMITIRGFLEGNPLYDSVFTQYGPAYYVYQWLLRSVLSIPLTHDATRLLCILHWLSASVTAGICGWLITRSLIWGWLVAMQMLVHLAPVANEPGHPQEVIALLLSGGAACAAIEWPLIRKLTWLSVICAVLAFIKINVGILFGFAIALSLIHATNNRLSRPPWAWIIAAGCIALPFVLMRRHLSMEWCRNYAVVAGIAILATLRIAHSPAEPRRDLDLHGVSRGAISFLIAAVAFAGIALLTGSTFHGLLDGLLLTPLRTPTIALLPIALPNLVLPSAIFALIIAFVVASRITNPRVAHFAQWLKLIYGVIGSFILVANPRLQLGYLAPWAWLLLMPTSLEATSASSSRFSRLFLCLAAVWQSLQAYPIGGTQSSLATMSLVIIYAIGLSDALRYFRRRVPDLSALTKYGLTNQTAKLVPMVGALALLYFFTNVWCDLPDVRRQYNSLPNLNMRGAKWVRTDAEQAEIHRVLAQYLESNCDTFITYPGVNSLYFWANKRPPTQFNCTGWGLLTHAQQKTIFAALHRSKQPLVVVVSAAYRGWQNGAPAPIEPLVSFVQKECRETTNIGSFVILRPINPAK